MPMDVSKKSKSRNVGLISLDESKQAQFKAKMKSKKTSKAFDSTQTGVIFLKHIPHGFFEPQMKMYFEQFGIVNKIRLSRSKRTGKSKGYAYIEFACEEVANIVAQTMNNYLMYERCLKCTVVPVDKLHPKTFKGHNQIFSKPATRKNSIRKFNERNSNSDEVRRFKRRNQKHLKLETKLKAMGINYDINNLVMKTDWRPPPRKMLQQKSDVDSPNVTKTVISKSDLSMSINNEMMIDKEDEEVVFKTPPKSSKVSIRIIEPNVINQDKKKISKTPTVNKSLRKAKILKKRKLLNMTM
uniref:MKI67 FHA domain-interacting nucleolar phosphoprotein-like n=1 Tax=Ciona intestinalis TaxID=7719 RepID=UPI000180C49D|nr:MKI67 FHA domain-interacting nucleolar phosphoprotein-like [Ciona intestinalis]|eukprot:XP_002128246.1 MKI67 FHA domain-interacting nucleolar phosphoprotein-like [Ciona intestinalis]